MNLNIKISMLKTRFNNAFDLGGLCFLHLQNEIDLKNAESIIDSYTGNLEKSAAYGFLAVNAGQLKFDEIYGQISNPTIKKSISVFHIIGICLLFKMHDDYRYQALLKDWFENHSLRVKFLISKFFKEYAQQFQMFLKIEKNDSFETKLLKNSFIKDSNLTLENDDIFNLEDIIHLIILIEYRKRHLRKYEIEKDELLELILFASREVQSKHKVFNNNEDQFNSVIHSMLSVKYFVENQSQRGLSSSTKTFGELDLKVFTKKNNYPLSIIECFVISSIDKSYISKHLNKLTVNYDPNGLSRNFAIIYVYNSKFNEIWGRYLEFLREFNYSIDLLEKRIIDDTANHPTFTNIKIGLATFCKNDMPIEIYHLFLNMQK